MNALGKADKLNLYWPSPAVQFNGRGISEAWAEEISAYGFEPTLDADSADLAFFISDSQLDERVIAKTTSICYFWGWPPERLLDKDFQVFAREKLRLLSLCTRILVPSPGVKDQLNTFGLPCQVCIPGVDLKSLGNPKGQVAADDRTDEIVFLSRLAPHKNLHALIEACACLQPSPPLVVIGPGDTAPYEAHAKQAGVRIAFLEPDDASKAMIVGRATMLVHPALYEGFGLGVLESLALGTPVVAYDTPHLRWLLKEWAIYGEGPDQLAQAMAQIMNRYGEALEMARRASETIKRDLSLKMAAERLWVHLHQSAKEWWGAEIRKDIDNPEMIKRAYEAEARRNWAYSFGPEEWNGPARFSPTWSRHWRSASMIETFKAAGVSKILDISCGPVYPCIYAMAGFDVEAFDVADETLRQARVIAEKYGVGAKVHTQQGWAQKLPYADNSQEAAGLGELLEHVPDVSAVLKEAIRVVKPGGVIALSTPYLQNHNDPMHLNHYTDSEFVEKYLRPLESIASIERVEKIAEAGTEPSCIFVVLKKR